MNLAQVLPRLARREKQTHMMASTLFCIAAVLAVIAALGDWEAARITAALALAGFVLIEMRLIPRLQQLAALALLGLAALLAGGVSDFAQALGQGVVRTLPFLLIFASVGWLRSAASESPSMIALREGLAQLGAGWRFAALGLSAHLMGAGFNLAGIGLLVPMLDTPSPDDSPAKARDGVRLRCAILWGFGAATCWSPFFVGTAAILAVLPMVGWAQAAPYGMTFAAGFLIYAMIYNRYLRGAARQSPPNGTSAAALLLRPALRLAGAVALLYAVTLTVIEGRGLALTTAIALIAPLFALGWLLLIHGRQRPARIGEVLTGIFHGYPTMRTETALFVCANVFGVAIDMMLHRQGMTGSDLGWLSTGSVFLNCLLTFWAYLAICALGIHPIVLVVVFASVADPLTLGLPLPVLAATMMALWGMGTSVSPLSGTTLLVAQLSGTSSFRVAWRWSGVFYILAAVWLAAAVSLLG